MVIAILLQKTSYLFSVCWYFKSHKILSHCLNPFRLLLASDHRQDKVEIGHTSKPTKRENPPTEGPPTCKTQVLTNGRKGSPRASIQGDQRDHTTESHRIPSIELHPTKKASKAEYWESGKQTKSIT